jgi:carbon storage regulator
VLTLTRSVGERIYIGEDIVVEVRAILDGRQVRIAIDAPRQVPIHRAEIFEAVSGQNRSAVLDRAASRFTTLLDASPRPAGRSAPSTAGSEQPAAGGGLSPSPEQHPGTPGSAGGATQPRADRRDP